MKVFLFGGKARSGKGTASRLLKEKLEGKGYKVCEIQIMRTLKGYVKDYFDWDGNEDTKPRRLLQELGYDIIRIKLNKPNFHLERLCEDIDILSNYFDCFIVNDIRLPEEFLYLKNKYDALSIHVQWADYQSPLTDTEQEHVTEHALDNFTSFDYDFISNGKEELEKSIDDMLEREMI